MKRTALILAAALLVGFGFGEFHQHVVPDIFASDPGPVPTCLGERATHVFLPDGDERDWVGVVESHPGDPDNAGTEYFRANGDTRDVLVAIQRTHSGGSIGAPFGDGNSDERDKPGDTYCILSPETDLVYASSNVKELDIVDATAGGNDLIYAHGGSLVVELGPAGEAPSGNFVWVGRVPRGGSVHIMGGPGTDHVYEGIHGKRVSYTYDGGPGFDHIHPCLKNAEGRYETYEGGPITPEKFKRLTGITVTNVEYIGSEHHLGAASPANACKGSL